MKNGNFHHEDTKKEESKNYRANIAVGPENCIRALEDGNQAISEIRKYDKRPWRGKLSCVKCGFSSIGAKYLQILSHS